MLNIITMENFLDRIDERAIFSKLLEREISVFAIVYGRRRIGKSALLKQVIDQKGIYSISEMTEKSIQIETLATQIASVIPGFDSVKFPSWISLFTTFENSLKTRVTLVLDEFPYLLQSSPELPSIIQKIVDMGTKTKFNLILCGSSQQMMREMMLGISSPLYGRADAILNIKAMKIAWLRIFLGCSAIDAVKEYATWGGVPRYWEIRKSYKTYQEAIKSAIFNKNGILIEEPMRLFLDDFRSAVQAYAIVNLVGNSNHKISEIAAKLGKPTTHLSRPMSNLIDMGYLRKEVPFGESEKDSKKGLYWISDHFMNFYMQHVAGNKSLIELDLWDVIEKQLNVKLPHLYANVWENLVRDAVPYMRIADIDWNKAYRYWGKPDKHTEIEIDVMAESVDKELLLVGEVKWSMNAHTNEISKSLDVKIALFNFSQKYKRVIKVIYVMDKANTITPNSCYLFDCEDVIPTIK